MGRRGLCFEAGHCFKAGQSLWPPEWLESKASSFSFLLSGRALMELRAHLTLHEHSQTVVMAKWFMPLSVALKG
jgi:hypothetical protein